MGDNAETGRIAPDTPDARRAVLERWANARWTDPAGQPWNAIASLAAEVLELRKRVSALEARNRPIA